ncbi:hypothetical protein F4780DRAFT_744664 [Xylariomycetidae sp. FL0641]|nr:hypothetical protein F4780DRAFT_744664 [Xylariomycetidae sp. FL0641]
MSNIEAQSEFPPSKPESSSPKPETGSPESKPASPAPAPVPEAAAPDSKPTKESSSSRAAFPEPPTKEFAFFSLRDAYEMKVKEQEARFEAEATAFTWPTMALASLLPNVDPQALLQFVESPVVRMAFLEFLDRTWNLDSNFPERKGRLQHRYIDYSDIRYARYALDRSKREFVEGKHGDESRDYVWTHGRNGAHDRVKTWPMGWSLYCMMDRCIYWAESACPSLPIKPYMQDGNQRNQIVFGALMVHIRLHSLGKLPSSVPEGRHCFDHESSYSPLWFPAWQAWRHRHNVSREYAHERAIHWARKVAEDYHQGNRPCETFWFETSVIDALEAAQQGDGRWRLNQDGTCRYDHLPRMERDKDT